MKNRVLNPRHGNKNCAAALGKHVGYQMKPVAAFFCVMLPVANLVTSVQKAAITRDLTKTSGAPDDLAIH
jgi:hypothetical protein